MGLVSNESAMAGNAVVITVPSRFSMKSAHATISGTTIGRDRRGSMR